MVRQHREERALAAHEEHRSAVAQPLARLGKREAELADPLECPFALSRADHRPNARRQEAK